MSYVAILEARVGVPCHSIELMNTFVSRVVIYVI